jgi:hypothetical protein
MATNEIRFIDGRPAGYTKYTVMPFSNWRALESFAKYIQKTRPSSQVENANANFKSFVEQKLRSGDTKSYGLFGKHPRNYEEAISRNKFLYYDEYKRIKEKVEKKIREELQKSSIVEAMKPRLVFNDKQIGEFVFDRAAMSLQPEIYYYSPSKKREVDALKEKIIYEGKKMFLESDKSLVVYALKVESEDGKTEFVEIKGESSLSEAVKKGIVSCTSANKKVYLYKEKKPKMFNGVKIIVGLTAGGFTRWDNDFYTGMAAVSCVDVLESLGYSVDVEVAVGGGRCGGCYKKLNFGGQYMEGRRFFTFTAKSFDEPMDLDGLLYTLCDPSFHNIKFISLLNYFFRFFGDELDTNANPSSTWHGISELDMVNPIGMYHKGMDIKKGNTNLIHFYIHQVSSEQDVIRQITDLVLTCENKNLEAIKKYSSHDFGIDK